mmetsp:Transcript_112292/g.356829  ORF Transcript_112292/g.356829 Transcript_112292/m.356829 type:complete len:210 (+) Transcript_112292:978-1607(+)
MPWSLKGVKSLALTDCTSTPRPPSRSKAANMPWCEVRSVGRKSAGHCTPTFCISATWGATLVLEGVSRASAKGAKAAIKLCAMDATSVWPAERRRSQPPAWHISWRVPLRVQGDIQFCTCTGPRSNQPSCISSWRSPLTCSKPRPNMMKTHMEIAVIQAPLKSFHGSMAGSHSRAFVCGAVWPFWPLAAFISCVRQVWPGSRYLGADTR